MNKNQERLVEDKDDKKIHINFLTFGDNEFINRMLDKEIPKNVEYISAVGDHDDYPDSTSMFVKYYCEEHYDYCPSCGQKLKW